MARTAGVQESPRTRNTKAPGKRQAPEADSAQGTDEQVVTLSDGANMLTTALAEVVGTFLLVLIGTGVATAAVLRQETAGPPYDSLAIALSFGLVLVAIVAALGQVSGAHVNPAVTLGLASVGKFPWRYVPAYLVAQVLGGVLAALAVWAAYGQAARDTAGLGAPAPTEGSTTMQGFLVEALIAFLLVFVVIAVATDPRVPAGSASMAIGFALAAGVLLGGPVSGGAGNPARALGPMIIASSYVDWAIYIVGPIVGGIVAALLYEHVVSKATTPKSAVADQSGESGATRPNERAATSDD